MPEMTVSEHNGQVAAGLSAIATSLGNLIDNTSRTQETHDTVISLEGKMNNVEKFMDRITKQLDELPGKLDACYARKEEIYTHEQKIQSIEDRAADKKDVADLSIVVTKISGDIDRVKNYLIWVAVTIIVAGSLLGIGIYDKIHL